MEARSFLLMSRLLDQVHRYHRRKSLKTNIEFNLWLRKRKCFRTVRSISIDSASANDTAPLFAFRLLLFKSKFNAPMPLPAFVDDVRVFGFFELVYTLKRSKFVGKHLDILDEQKI